MEHIKVKSYIVFKLIPNLVCNRFLRIFRRIQAPPQGSPYPMLGMEYGRFRIIFPYPFGMLRKNTVTETEIKPRNCSGRVLK